MTADAFQKWIRAFAKRLFDVYNEQGPNPWKTWDGKPVPHWDELNDQVRAKWTAVALEAAQELDE